MAALATDLLNGPLQSKTDGMEAGRDRPQGPSGPTRGCRSRCAVGRAVSWLAGTGRECGRRRSPCNLHGEGAAERRAGASAQAGKKERGGDGVSDGDGDGDGDGRSHGGGVAGDETSKGAPWWLQGFPSLSPLLTRFGLACGL